MKVKIFTVGRLIVECSWETKLSSLSFGVGFFGKVIKLYANINVTTQSYMKITVIFFIMI